MEDTRLCKAVVIHFDAKQDFGHHLLDIYQGINIELEYFLLGLMLYLGEVSDSVESPDLYMKDVFMIFRRIMEISIKKYNEKCISIVIEENYVDRIYRSSYYSRYSYKHFNVGRQCLRLFIFIGDINTLNYYDDYSLEMCKTLEQRFVGFLVLTPNQGCTISRSVFTPNFFVDELLVNTMIRIADYRCTMYGHRLSLQGFPYLKQDSDSISCAEVTLLLITDYYSQMYQEFSVAMPNDVLALINRHDPQRISPSHGVKYDTLSRVLKDQGFYPLLISTEEIHDNVQSRAKYILHSYLDSCIPVAIHISNNENQDSINHSVLCIGYGGKNLENITSNIRIKSMVGIKSENNNNSINYIYIVESSYLYDTYYVMDDNRLPYAKMKYEEREVPPYGFTRYTVSVLDDKEITNIVIPLNKRMSLKASDALIIFTEFLSGQGGLTYQLCNCLDEQTQQKICQELKCQHIPGIKKEEPLIIRVFLTANSTFKSKRAVDMCKDAARIYSEIPFPRFIWVCELYSRDSFQCNKVIGEIIVDATSANVDRERSIILCHYPYMMVYRYPDESYYTGLWADKFNSPEGLRDWHVFTAFEFNHTAKE